MGADNDSARPVSESNLKSKWPPRGLFLEAKLMRKKTGLLLALIKLSLITFITYIMIKFNLKTKNLNLIQYKKDTILNADYQKFDDMMRMVLDCSLVQIEQIENYLKDTKDRGKIFYGTHVSDEALMTCLVFSLNNDGHTHFIDGANGGYAAAATIMKKQIKEA